MIPCLKLGMGGNITAPGGPHSFRLPCDENWGYHLDGRQQRNARLMIPVSIKQNKEASTKTPCKRNYRNNCKQSSKAPVSWTSHQGMERSHWLRAGFLESRHVCTLKRKKAWRASRGNVVWNPHHGRGKTGKRQSRMRLFDTDSGRKFKEVRQKQNIRNIEISGAGNKKTK